MTKFEAIEIIEKYCFDNNIIGKESKAFQLAVNALYAEEKPCTPSEPDYKSEYPHLMETIGKLEAENIELKDTLIVMCKKFCKE